MQPDGPLGPLLIERGFQRLGDLGELHKRLPTFSEEERLTINGICVAIAVKRNHLPELPLFAYVGGLVSLTVFVDIKCQVWYAEGNVDLRSIGIDELGDV